MKADISVIARADLGASLDRLDPEFVRSSHLEQQKLLQSVSASRLALSCDLNPRSKLVTRDDDEEFAYVDLDAVQLEDGLTFADPLRFGDRPSRAKHLLRKDDLLIANVRPTRGAVALTTSALAGAVASSGFTIARAHDAKMVPYLFLFLRSRWGRDQLVRRSRGSMYPAVLERDVAEVLVPDPSDALLGKAREAVESCLAHWKTFFENHEKAQSRLDQILLPIGAPPPLDATTKASIDAHVIHRSDCFRDDKSARMDAEFFRSEYFDFESRAKAAGAVRLGEVADPKQGRARGGASLVPTFRQGVLTNHGINWAAVALEKGNAQANAQVREGDVLLAAMAHEARYLARKADAVTNLPAAYASSNQAVHHLMVLRLKSGSRDRISSPYLAALLRSPFGMRQVQRCNRGLRGDHVLPEDLAETVMVPIPDKTWLEEFDDEMNHAEQSRAAAARAIAEGVSAVETWVVQKTASRG